MKAHHWAKVRLGLNIYIAVAITVLGILFLPSLGTNDSQNHRLAVQAKKLAELNRRNAIAGCHRSNFTRRKVNTVAGALTELLEKSIAEGERQGRTLTQPQAEFVAKEFRLLRPLNIVPCREHFPKKSKAE